MARRTATSYRSSRTVTTAPAEGGETETTSETVVTTEDPGLGLAEALSIATTIVLVAALVALDMYLGKRYGKGIFFN